MRAVGRVVHEGATLLENGFHPERARRDAETLMLHMLGRNRAWLIAHGSEELPDALCANYAAMVARRRRGEPVQYITGEQEFYGLPFGVTPDVLIPRPETEHLVEKALEAAAEWEKPRILDVGTGSGAIAIVLACQLPQAEVTALDVSAAALDVARSNERRNGIEGLIQFLESDLLDGVAGVSFEIIVSNPPVAPASIRPRAAWTRRPLASRTAAVWNSTKSASDLRRLSRLIALGFQSTARAPPPSRHSASSRMAARLLAPDRSASSLLLPSHPATLASCRSCFLRSSESSSHSRHLFGKSPGVTIAWRSRLEKVDNHGFRDIESDDGFALGVKPDRTPSTHGGGPAAPGNHAVFMDLFARQRLQMDSSQPIQWSVTTRIRMKLWRW